MQKTCDLYLSLSLFIILLTFFVFLNSLASKDVQRTRSVSRSLETTFATKTRVPNDFFIIDPFEGSVERPGFGDVPQRLKKIEALFRSHIKGISAHSTHRGTQMYMTGKARAFEEALEKSVMGQTSAFEGFLTSLLTALDTGGIEMEIELTLGVGTSLGTLDSTILQEATLRTDLMAKQLETLGLPERLVRVGLGPGPAERLEIIVRPVMTEEPL